MSIDAVKLYREHFETVIKFLRLTTSYDDVAWRNARRLLVFHEMRGTCLGYGVASISGSAFGRQLTNRVLRVGKEVVDLGVADPDLFVSMALFEKDIGPDRISDMATNVVRAALLKFNRRILDYLGLKGEDFYISGIQGQFLRNPFQATRTPIILVPTDVLRKLPIAIDWDGIEEAAWKNEVLRNNVNRHIGEIWASKTKRDKEKLREQALSSREAFQTLLDSIHEVPLKPYDVSLDYEGLIKWAHIAKVFASQYPLDLSMLRQPKDLDEVYRVVGKIIDQFAQLVEHNGLNKELYKSLGKPRYCGRPANLPKTAVIQSAMS
jgi:DNA-directed RNA polymerase subunit N (RpoN/RPB10)